jgi:hypothetical protein
MPNQLDDEPPGQSKICTKERFKLKCSESLEDLQLSMRPFNVAKTMASLPGWSEFMVLVSKMKLNTCVSTYFHIEGSELSMKHALEVAEMAQAYKGLMTCQTKMQKALATIAPLVVKAIQDQFEVIPREKLVIQQARIVKSVRPTDVLPSNSLKDGHVDLFQRELLAVVLEQDPGTKQGIEFHALDGSGIVKIKIGKLEAYYAKMSLSMFYFHLSRWLPEGTSGRAVLLLSLTRESLPVMSFDMHKARSGHRMHWKKHKSGCIVEDQEAKLKCDTDDCSVVSVHGIDQQRVLESIAIKVAKAHTLIMATAQASQQYATYGDAALYARNKMTGGDDGGITTGDNELSEFNDRVRRGVTLDDNYAVAVALSDLEPLAKMLGVCPKLTHIIEAGRGADARIVAEVATHNEFELENNPVVMR